MAKKHINKNKFKGSLKTVFTDVPLYKTEIGYPEPYYTICTDIWDNFPSKFPSSIIGPVPLQFSGYNNELLPYFNESTNSNVLWPIVITPSGCTSVNENIENNSDIPYLNYPLGPYADSNGFKLGRTYIFIGSKKVIEKYPDFYYFKKYPNFWKKVWYMRLDLSLYGLHEGELSNSSSGKTFASKVFNGITGERLLR